MATAGRKRASKAKTGAAPGSATPAMSASDIERVLGSGALEGFTPGIARQLCAKFGAKTVEEIATWDPGAKALLGARWSKASDEILEHGEALPMLAWLLRRGFSGVMARRVMVWQRHESDWKDPQAALDAWSADPYLLAEVPGVSFERADRLALEAGADPEGAVRLLACAREALRVSCDDAGGGASLDDAQAKAKKLLEANSRVAPARLSTLARDCLELAQKEGIAKMAKDEKGRPMVFSAELYEAEEKAAHMLLGMLEQPSPLSATGLDERVAALEAITRLTLHDEQRAALATVFKGRVSVVCGKPGSGKTTLLKCAAPLLEDGGKKVLYAAPTGKAAKRMSQALGRRAVTLHRLLEVGFSGDKKGKPKAKAGAGIDGGAALNVREADAVVIDESSMLDSKMFLRLLKSLGPRTALILMGDPEQLPSVQAGKVLRDLIDSGRAPTAIMTKVMRQSANSSITSVARAVGEGRWVDFRDRDADCLFLDAPDAGEIASRIAKMLLGAARSKYDPLKDCQILCAGNKGPAGVHEMNARLQALLNPPAAGKEQATIKEGLTLRVGDKVMQLTNDYERELRPAGSARASAPAGGRPSSLDLFAQVSAELDEGVEDGLGKKGVFNGDVGYVEEILERPHPGRVRVRYEDGVAEYDFKEAAMALTLAYACTVHKFQGSEAPLVYFVMHESTPMPLRTRNLVYTAITRAKQKCIVMGSESALRMAVSRDALVGRRTRLKGLLDGSITVDETAGAAVLAHSERLAFERLVREAAADMREDARRVEATAATAANDPADPGREIEAPEPAPKRRRARSL